MSHCLSYYLQLSVGFSADLGEKDDGNTSRQKEKDAGNNLPDSAVFTAAVTPSPMTRMSTYPLTRRRQRLNTWWAPMTDH